MEFSWEDALAQLSNFGHIKVLTIFQYWLNEMNHITSGPGREGAVINGTGTGDRSIALCSGQKYVVWIDNVIRNFILPRQTFIASNAGMFALANTCMLLLKHQHLVQWKIDFFNIKGSLLGVADVWESNMKEWTVVFSEVDGPDCRKGVLVCYWRYRC